MRRIATAIALGVALHAAAHAQDVDTAKSTTGVWVGAGYGTEKVSVDAGFQYDWFGVDVMVAGLMNPQQDRDYDGKALAYAVHGLVAVPVGESLSLLGGVGYGLSTKRRGITVWRPISGGYEYPDEVYGGDAHVGEQGPSFLAGARYRTSPSISLGAWYALRFGVSAHVLFYF